MALGSAVPYMAPKVTKLPMAALTALSGGLLVHSLVVSFIFPFAPIMVSSFRIATSSSEAGFYAGILASAYFFGSLVAGPLWGCLSDVLGRKAVVLVGLASNALLGTMFGFSGSLAVAVGLRFLLGLFCTVFIAAKTALTELCDDTNQAQGFAIFGLCWALGIILGPVLGGVLAEPAKKFPTIFAHHSIFATFPFLLPCLVLGILSVLAAVFCVFFLPETLGRNPLPRVEAMARTPRSSEDGGDRLGGAKPTNSAEKWMLVEEGGLEENLLPAKGEAMHIVLEDDPGFFRVVFCDPDTLMTGCIFCLCGFMPVAFDALFPMWSLSDWQDGGLGFTTTNLGLAQAASGVSLVPITLVIYPWLVNQFGAVTALQLSLLTGVFQACIPLVRLLRNKIAVDIACVIIFALRSFNMTGMAAMFILTANSVRYPQYMGAVNGILATVQNIVQAIAPIAVGAIFAWSASNREAFPFDYHLTWLILGGLHVLLLVLTCFLPPHLNRRKYQV